MLDLEVLYDQLLDHYNPGFGYLVDDSCRILDFFKKVHKNIFTD